MHNDICFVRKIVEVVGKGEKTLMGKNKTRLRVFIGFSGNKFVQLLYDWIIFQFILHNVKKKKKKLIYDFMPTKKLYE